MKLLHTSEPQPQDCPSPQGVLVLERRNKKPSTATTVQTDCRSLLHQEGVCFGSQGTMDHGSLDHALWVCKLGSKPRGLQRKNVRLTARRNRLKAPGCARSVKLPLKETSDQEEELEMGK